MPQLVQRTRSYIIRACRRASCCAVLEVLWRGAPKICRGLERLWNLPWTSRFISHMLRFCSTASTGDRVENTALTMSLVCVESPFLFEAFPKSSPKLTCSTVYHDTTVSQGSGPRMARISNVFVVLEQTTDPSKPSTIQEIKCNAVDVEFGNSNGTPSAQNYQNTLTTRH